MTNELSVEEAIEVLKFMKRGVLEESKEDKVLDMAIKALEQQPITWIVGKDNCQVAVRNMPIDKMQKICAIIGEEEQQPCEDAISRKDALKAIEEQKKGFYGVERYAIDECHSAVMKLPSVRPCREIVEDKRACEKCIHYVTRDSRGVVLCGCDSWECDFEPKEVNADEQS